MAEAYPTGECDRGPPNWALLTCLIFTDTPIKRFAQRYIYLGIDTIAGHDLGFAQRSRQSPASAAGPIPAPSNTGFAIAPPTGPASDRIPPRRASPDNRGRRREPSPPPAKRFKPSSPPPGPARREREPQRPAPPPRRPSPPPPAKEEPTIPGQLLWFIGTLPSAAAFDGESRSRAKAFTQCAVRSSCRIFSS